MAKDHIETLKHARALAGGVSKLAEKIGLDVYVLDEMLHGVIETPPWVFERAAKFIEEADPSSDRRQ